MGGGGLALRTCERVVGGGRRKRLAAAGIASNARQAAFNPATHVPRRVQRARGWRERVHAAQPLDTWAGSAPAHDLTGCVQILPALHWPQPRAP